MSERLVIVVGAGLAGLAAAVAAREQGADVLVLERDAGPGGATGASAGWIWRYRDLRTARACAPHGDALVQRAVVDRLDRDIEWLERTGVRRIATGTGRTFTEGLRVDPVQALDALAGALGEERIEPRSQVTGARVGRDGAVELRVRRGRPGTLAEEPDRWLAADAVVFAGGGYARDRLRIAREATAPPEAVESWVLRAPRGGDGSSMDAAVALGALRVPATGESLARVVPSVDAGVPASELVRFGELHLEETVLRGAGGAAITRRAHDWSGAQVVWELARTSGSGRLELERGYLRREIHGGTVEDAVRAAISLGAESGRIGRSGVWLAVSAGITHTLCGLRVDADGRVFALQRQGSLRRRPVARPLREVFAAGCDAAGSGLGGTASGLAQALVLGRRAGMLAGAGRAGRARW